MQQSGYRALRRVLFRLDPEIAHNISLYLLALAPKVKPVRRWLTYLLITMTHDLLLVYSAYDLSTR